MWFNIILYVEFSVSIMISAIYFSLHLSCQSSGYFAEGEGGGGGIFSFCSPQFSSLCDKL